MIRYREENNDVAASLPRTRGDDPTYGVRRYMLEEFAPHARG